VCVLCWNRHIFQMCCMLFYISHRSEWVWDASCWSFLTDDAGERWYVSQDIQPFSNQAKPLLFLDICSKFYCRFVLVYLDYKVIQFMYTNFTTSALHGLRICRKHWLTQELFFTVNLFTWTVLTHSKYNPKVIKLNQLTFDKILLWV
jgi:hypothetical protein